MTKPTSPTESPQNEEKVGLPSEKRVLTATPICILAHELVNKLSAIVGQIFRITPARTRAPPRLPFAQQTQKNG